MGILHKRDHLDIRGSIVLGCVLFDLAHKVGSRIVRMSEEPLNVHRVCGACSLLPCGSSPRFEELVGEWF